MKLAEWARGNGVRPQTAYQARLRALQRKAARQAGPCDTGSRRKRQPSNRWQRTQARIGSTHARAANLRRDALHKATTRLAQHHQVITVETLRVAGMRSAGGARKRGLDRDLADAAINLARLGDPARGTRTGTGSSPAARHRVGEGRGARQETEPAPAGDAAGREASTRYQHQLGQTGTASPQGEAA